MFEQNLAAVIAPVVLRSGLALIVDAQDGYGDQLEQLIVSFNELGVVGHNVKISTQNQVRLFPPKLRRNGSLWL
jgi:2-methylisocitrate lyase-like PEP mutase family enzyme